MFKNYFKVAFRNFLRQRLYSIINVVGLCSGLICTLFIFLWVRDEIQKDAFHQDSSKIYRVLANLHIGEQDVVTWGETPGPLADDIRDNIPEVEFAARTMNNGPQLFKYEDKNFLEKGLYADPDFFKIFSFHISKGTVTPPKLDKKWVAISQKLSSKLFGQQEAIGKTVNVSDKYDVTVVAVFDDVQSRSSLQFDYILPFEIYKEIRGAGFHWGNYDHPLYLKFFDEEKADGALAKINARASKHEELKDVKFYVQPFHESYLHSHFENGHPSGGRAKYVNLFSIVAVFILLIACINFMNMATARAAGRAKEIGVRKVAGAHRLSLISQFFTESLLVSFLSMFLAAAVVYMILPLFNIIVHKDIVLNFSDPGLLLAMTGIALITGILAGAYPAIFLSAYQPASVLKGTSSSSLGTATLRRGLVVFQFSLSVVLVAGALIIYNQMEYIRNINLGYNRESVLAFTLRGADPKNNEAIRNEALQSPAIKMISSSNSSLVQVNNQTGSLKWPGKADDDKHLFRSVVVDYDFLETMGLHLKEGRFFSKNFNDSSNFILSQKSVDAMGLQNPLGQKITMWGNVGVVVGVVEDFHSRSLHESIDPVVFMCKPQWTNRFFVRFESNQAPQAIAHLKTISQKYSPEYPFEYSFLDDDFEKLYDNEKITSFLALSFTVMAIIISGLGLLGLASYTTERKKKEISIRKTLGASVMGLVTMMSKDFIRLSLIAILAGTPIAYYLMGKFLEGYAYHIELGWAVFGITALVVLMVTLVTVILQVSKAAVANPVDALRNE